MYFDTHAHYDDRRYDKDRDEALAAAKDAGVALILNASSSVRSARFGIKLSERYDFVYASAGVHPHDAKSMSDGTVDELKELLQHPKALAVGEIGLDYYHDFSPRDVQKQRFRDQLELARDVKKPVIIHVRDSWKDSMDIMAEYNDLCCVFHCYSGSWEMAKKILNYGWYLSFAGVITFKNAAKSIEVIEKMPRDKILIETDCPYLTPEPKRGKRNGSDYLPYTNAKLAQILGISNEEAALLTMTNGKRFFRID